MVVIFEAGESWAVRRSKASSDQSGQEQVETGKGTKSGQERGTRKEAYVRAVCTTTGQWRFTGQGDGIRMKSYVRVVSSTTGQCRFTDQGEGVIKKAYVRAVFPNYRAVEVHRLK